MINKSMTIIQVSGLYCKGFPTYTMGAGKKEEVPMPKKKQAVF